MAELNGRALIASRCAKFFKDGDFVNLGIGVPLMCVNYLPDGVDLWLEAEIGTVGSGPSPQWSEADIDIIDAGGMPASVIKGGSVYEHPTGFDIRHIGQQGKQFQIVDKVLRLLGIAFNLKCKDGTAALRKIFLI